MDEMDVVGEEMEDGGHEDDPERGKKPKAVTAEFITIGGPSKCADSRATGGLSQTLMSFSAVGGAAFTSQWGR